MSPEKEATLKEVCNKLDRSETILRDIARWLRFQNIGKLKEVLLVELDTDEKKLAFESTDGKKGFREVASISGAPQDTVYGWWKKWFNLGILEPSEIRKGRLRRICSLEDVGITVPKAAIPKDESTQEGAKTETVPEGNKKEPTEQKPEAT